MTLLIMGLKSCFFLLFIFLNPNLLFPVHSLLTVSLSLSGVWYRVTDLLEYSPDELVGRSLYTLIYGQDVMQIRKFHSDCKFFNLVFSKKLVIKNEKLNWWKCTNQLIENLVLHKGQVMSKYYRIMNKNGGFCWIQTCSTLINTNSTAPSNGKSTPSSQSSTTTPNSNSTVAPSTNATASSPPVEEQEQCIISINYVIRLVS